MEAVNGLFAQLEFIGSGLAGLNAVREMTQLAQQIVMEAECNAKGVASTNLPYSTVASVGADHTSESYDAIEVQDDSTSAPVSDQTRHESHTDTTWIDAMDMLDRSNVDEERVECPFGEISWDNFDDCVNMGSNGDDRDRRRTFQSGSQIH